MRVGVVRLILATDDGEVLDTTEVTREEFDRAAKAPELAASILRGLQPGKAAN